MAIKTMDDLNLDGSRVFLRLDLNVQLDEDACIVDDQRILAALPTIQELLEREARLIVAAHLGRPAGKRDPALSIEPVAARLAHLLDVEVMLSEDSVGDGPRKMAFALREGQLMMLENLRFYPGETENDEAFARQLGLLADVYVNDAFASLHRNHASVAGVPRYLKSHCVGRLAARELEQLGRLKKPARPFIAIVGGAKIKDKVDLLLSLAGNADALCIGGAMAIPFLAAKGVLPGCRVEPEAVSLADKVLRKAAKTQADIVLPVDHVVTSSPDRPEDATNADNGAFPQGAIPVDIGPKTGDLFRARLERCQAVLWNGPLGMYEVDAYTAGTKQMGRAIARSNAYSVVVGTDSVEAIRRCGLTPFISHLSYGGSAAIKYIEGAVLPGLAALEEE